MKRGRRDHRRRWIPKKTLHTLAEIIAGYAGCFIGEFLLHKVGVVVGIAVGTALAGPMGGLAGSVIGSGLGTIAGALLGCAIGSRVGEALMNYILLDHEHPDGDYDDGDDDHKGEETFKRSIRKNL